MERLERMDEYGMYAQVVYPNVGGFGSGNFLQLTDEELRLDCVRAYNDFLVEWTSVEPSRFHPHHGHAPSGTSRLASTRCSAPTTEATAAS